MMEQMSPESMSVTNRRSWRLVVDPLLTKGGRKLYKFDDSPAPDCALLREDPRKRQSPLLQPINLPVPKLKVDENSRLSKELGIINLNETVSADELKRACSNYGTVVRTRVLFHPSTKAPLRLGRVVFESIKHAQNFYERFNNAQFLGKSVKIFRDYNGTKLHQLYKETLEKSKKSASSEERKVQSMGAGKPAEDVDPRIHRMSGALPLVEGAGGGGQTEAVNKNPVLSYPGCVSVATVTPPVHAAGEPCFQYPPPFTAPPPPAAWHPAAAGAGPGQRPPTLVAPPPPPPPPQWPPQAAAVAAAAAAQQFWQTAPPPAIRPPLSATAAATVAAAAQSGTPQAVAVAAALANMPNMPSLVAPNFLSVQRPSPIGFTQTTVSKALGSYDTALRTLSTGGSGAAVAAGGGSSAVGASFAPTPLAEFGSANAAVKVGSLSTWPAPPPPPAIDTRWKLNGEGVVVDTGHYRKAQGVREQNGPDCAAPTPAVARLPKESLPESPLAMVASGDEQPPGDGGKSRRCKHNICCPKKRMRRTSPVSVRDRSKEEVAGHEGLVNANDVASQSAVPVTSISPLSSDGDLDAKVELPDDHRPADSEPPPSNEAEEQKAVEMDISPLSVGQAVTPISSDDELGDDGLEVTSFEKRTMVEDAVLRQPDGEGEEEEEEGEESRAKTDDDPGRQDGNGSACQDSGSNRRQQVYESQWKEWTVNRIFTDISESMTASLREELKRRCLEYASKTLLIEVVSDSGCSANAERHSIIKSVEVSEREKSAGSPSHPEPPCTPPMSPSTPEQEEDSNSETSSEETNEQSSRGSPAVQCDVSEPYHSGWTSSSNDSVGEEESSGSDVVHYSESDEESDAETEDDEEVEEEEEEEEADDEEEEDEDEEEEESDEEEEEESEEEVVDKGTKRARMKFAGGESRKSRSDWIVSPDGKKRRSDVLVINLDEEEIQIASCASDFDSETDDDADDASTSESDDGCMVIDGMYSPRQHDHGYSAGQEEEEEEETLCNSNGLALWQCYQTPCTSSAASQYDEEVKTVFPQRGEESEAAFLCNLSYATLDLEDLRYLKTAYPMALTAQNEMKRLRWSRPKEEFLLRYIVQRENRRRRSTIHRSGSARTEGFYRLSKKQKSAQKSRVLQKMTTSEDNAKAVVAQEVRAQARALQRLLYTNYGTEMDSDWLKYDQMQYRSKLVRFDTSKIHGWGLFAMEDIAPDEMIIEYVGQKIRMLVAERREKIYEERGIGSSYLFRIDQESVIDATNHGNMARFINHSCAPNCYAKVVMVNGIRRIVIYSKQAISRGEEITYDYKFPLEEEKIPCNCRSFNCRGTLN